jgi:hypothetical protein
VVRACERAQVGNQLVAIARREQGGHQDHVGDARRERGDGRVARIDNDQLRVYAFADDALQDRRLPAVRFDC